MNTAVTTYLVYLVISLTLMFWVGRTLQANGGLFLVDVFRGNTALAQAVNHLLVVGFYLINLGFVCLTLRMTDAPQNAQAAIESLSIKIGGVLLVLGVLHLANVFIFNRIRSAAQPRMPRATGWAPATEPARPSAMAPPA